MSLWLCLRLPDLPLECLPQVADEPVIVIERQRVVCANAIAEEAGVRPGQTTETVRSLFPDSALSLHERDKAREKAALASLLNWAYGITPTLELWQDDGLQLELGRCQRLHAQGMEALLDEIRQNLVQRGFNPCFGMANSRPAAWLLSHCTDARATEAGRPAAERLATLPLTFARHASDGRHSEAITSLEHAGITDFGALLNLPRAALSRRCGQSFGQWLDAVVADSDDVTRDYKPPPVFQDALWFGFEVRQTSELQPAMTQLTASLGQFLRNSQFETDTLIWELLRMRGAPQRFSVRSSEPHGDTARWLSLSNLRLDKVSIGDDIEGLGLRVTELSGIQTGTAALFSDNRGKEPASNLVDRLRTRLGLQAVGQLCLRDAHLPEHSQNLGQDGAHTPVVETTQAQRPFWLMHEPQPVHIQDDTLYWNGPLELIYGPERIEDEWWRQPVSRDYYIARSADGQPLWLYQDRHSRRWYLHGLLP